MAEDVRGGRHTGSHSIGVGEGGGTPGASAPDDRQALAEEIERTREELGATVEALAAKADVMARAREKAGDLSGRVTSAVSQAGTELRASAGQLRTSAGELRGGAANLAARAGSTVRKATPDPVQRAAGRAANGAVRHRVPLAAAAAILAAGWLIVAWRRR
jgi:ABC-type transporter Mla subunit MlaD